jgi:hypothetical protein
VVNVLGRSCQQVSCHIWSQWHISVPPFANPDNVWYVLFSDPLKHNAFSSSSLMTYYSNIVNPKGTCCKDLHFTDALYCSITLIPFSHSALRVTSGTAGKKRTKRMDCKPRAVGRAFEPNSVTYKPFSMKVEKGRITVKRDGGNAHSAGTMGRCNGMGNGKQARTMFATKHQ